MGHSIFLPATAINKGRVQKPFCSSKFPLTPSSPLDTFRKLFVTFGRKSQVLRPKKHILECFGTSDPPPLFCLGPFPKWHHFRILIVSSFQNIDRFFITWMVGGNPLACFDQECCPQRDNQPTMVPTEWAWGHLLTHIGQTNSPPTPLGLTAV